MLNIHDVRTVRNYKAFDEVCKKENVDFFVMIDLVKLLKGTLDYGEKIDGKRIKYSRVEDKATLGRLLDEAHTLFDIGREAFEVKYETINIIERIYEIQREEDRNAMKYRIEFGSVNFSPNNNYLHYFW